MADDTTPKPAKLDGGFFVLMRTGVGDYYDGNGGWVDDFRECRQYLGPPTEDFFDAERDRDRLTLSGSPCSIYYVGEPQVRKR